MSVSGPDGIAGLTSTTLDNDFSLHERIKLPPNIPLEKYINLNINQPVDGFISTLCLL